MNLDKYYRIPEGIGLLLASLGIVFLVSGPDYMPVNTAVLTGLIFVMTGTMMVGGIPEVNKWMRRIKISLPIFFFVLGLVLSYIQLKGTEEFFTMILGWVIGGLLSGALVGFVQSYLGDLE